jgi:hypothetical protein
MKLAKILTTALHFQEVLCRRSARRGHALYGNFFITFVEDLQGVGMHYMVTSL